MTIYDRYTRKAHTINARECAPMKSLESMYWHNPDAAAKGWLKIMQNFQTPTTTRFIMLALGALSIAVPGEVRGYWLAYNRFGGGVTWKELFEPSIKLCEKGIPVGLSLLKAIQENKEMFDRNDDFKFVSIDIRVRQANTSNNTVKIFLSYLFINMESGAELKYADKFINLRLAQTLRTIAEEGGDAFYEGPLAHKIVTSIRLQGGIITEDDFKKYQ